MSSWDLFRHFLRWEEFPASRTALFLRETGQPLVWQELAGRLPRIRPAIVLPLLILVFVLLRIASPSLAARCLTGPALMLGIPLLLLPSLVLWIVPLSLALAPIIARERHHQSWELLRATPYSAEELLLTKAGGALWRLHGLISRLGSLQAQVLAAIVLGLGIMEFLGNVDGVAESSTTISRNVLCMGTLVLVLVVAVVLLLDRLQQIILMVVAALFAGASTASTQTAVMRAVTASFIAWGLDFGAGVLVIALQPPGHVEDFGFSVAAIVMLGPVAGYVLELAPLAVAALMVATLVTREAIIRTLWRLAVRGAQQL